MYNKIIAAISITLLILAGYWTWQSRFFASLLFIGYLPNSLPTEAENSIDDLSQKMNNWLLWGQQHRQCMDRGLQKGKDSWKHLHTLIQNCLGKNLTNQ